MAKTTLFPVFSTRFYWASLFASFFHNVLKVRALQRGRELREVFRFAQFPSPFLSIMETQRRQQQRIVPLFIVSLLIDLGDLLKLHPFFLHIRTLVSGIFVLCGKFSV